MAVIQVFLSKDDLFHPGKTYPELKDVSIRDFKIDVHLVEKASFIAFIEKDIKKILKVRKEKSFSISTQKVLSKKQLRETYKRCTRVLKTSMKEINSRSRKKLIAKKRIAIGAYLSDIFIYNTSLYNEKLVTLEDIGNVIKRDHSTIIHYRKARPFDDQIISFVEELNLRVK